MKKIRSKVVKESLMDYANLANTLKENSSEIVQSLLKETVRDAFNSILNEEEEDKEDEYEVEEVKDGEVEDTDSETEENDAEKITETDDEDTEDTEVLNTDESSDIDSEDEDDETVESEESFEMEEDSDGEDAWAEFDKYKIEGEDGGYDFSQADDDEVVRVYKLLKDTDQVVVNHDKAKNKVDFKDNETGTEYIIDLGGDDGEDDAEETDDYEFTDMNESRIFEVALNEYDSHVGYTDNYQKTDVMTTPSMEEPGKNVSDWDAGVPKSKSKPWAGNAKKHSAPFNEEDEMGGDMPMDEEEDFDTMNEEDEMGGDMSSMEEANLSQSRWNDTHAAHNRVPAANDDAHRRDGMQKTSKGSNYRAVGGGVNETIIRKHKEIVRENKELKMALKRFKKTLEEAAVTNLNLGQIVRLVTENTTSRDEKDEIIKRFGKEANTLQESKALYRRIENELKKRQKMNINEEKQFTTQGSTKINETTIHTSKDLLDALDLMHRVCK